MELILKYFPELNPAQISRFEILQAVLPKLNQGVNVISRKDIGALEERHILHSLAIAKQFTFGPHTQVMDVGTGGGFPGIPLAILFPDTQFTLVDSIRKKIHLVEALCDALDMENVLPIHGRMEELKTKTDFVVSRAVTAFPRLYQWTQALIRPGISGSMPNGLISLKGGNLEEELRPLRKGVKQFPVSEWFEEPFFSSKVIVYLKK